MPWPSQCKRRAISLPPIARLLLLHSACRLPNLNVSQYFLIGCQPFEPAFFEKGLRLDVRIDRDISVSGETALLQRLMDILLDNALKYSSPGGTAWVTLQKQGNRRCRLVVKNQGERIPPEDIKNIFKRFYRVDRARSRDGSFGLGLSIAENIVVQHRGSIWAESEDGVNSFFVELPCV